MLKKKCKTCGKVFFKKSKWSYGEFKARKFCSHGCQRHTVKTRAKISKVKFGLKQLPQTRIKISLSLSGQKNPRWEGNKVGYDGIHDWIKSKLGKPKKCQHCGKDGLVGIQIQWANKDHKYKRNINDWLRLCASCHDKYDQKHGLRKRLK